MKQGREHSRNAGLQKRQDPHVAEQAAMIGGMVLYTLRRERRGLRHHHHTQQEEDNQQPPVAVNVALHVLTVSLNGGTRTV